MLPLVSKSQAHEVGEFVVVSVNWTLVEPATIVEGDHEKLATGPGFVGLTVMVAVFGADEPLMFVAVSDRVNVPSVVYRCEQVQLTSYGFCSLETGVPSPQSHVHAVGA